jgi:hypothetical protein
VIAANRGAADRTIDALEEALSTTTGN